jgi:aryl-alcohol dehydrogenase-like predicted oxidoreductase
LPEEFNMQYRQLGTTGLKVSKICLGTMTWGEQNTEAEAHRQLDIAVDAGVNFIDTAELYPVPPRATTYGRTEAFIGNWLAGRPDRDRLVIASKVAGPAAGNSGAGHIRNGPRLSAEQIVRACDDSLRRLQTDVIDLYQLHWPERATNFFGKLGYQHENRDGIALEETLEALAGLVRAGKIRHIGLSNETPWGLMHCLQLAEKRGLPRVQSVQNPYSLLNRSYEVGLAEMSIREKAGLLAYSPLAFGVLSGKYLDGARPEGARLTLFSRFARYSGPGAIEATRAYVQLARELDMHPATLALAFVTQQPFVTSNIIGATTETQLKMNLDSARVQLSDEVIRAIDAIHDRYPYPSP